MCSSTEPLLVGVPISSSDQLLELWFDEARPLRSPVTSQSLKFKLGGAFLSLGLMSLPSMRDLFRDTARSFADISL